MTSATRSAVAPDARAVGVLLTLTAVVAWNRVVFDAWMARVDVLTFYLPWYAFLGEQLRAFDVPGWNPHQFSGTPFAGDPQSGWMYLPAMLVFPFLPAITAFKTMVVVQLIIAGLSTYALARVLGMGVLASFIAAVVFTFGPFLQWNTYCCTVRAQLATWIPLALLGVELALRPDRWRARILPWCLAGFAVSQMFAGWLGQGTMNGLLLVGSYLGYRALLSSPVAGRALGARATIGATTGIVVIVLGLALGAAGILPRLDVNAETNLAGGRYDALGSRAADRGYALDTLLGHLLADGYEHRAVALGGTAIVLALLAPALARRRFAVPYFAAMTIVVFTLSLDTTPLHWLFYLIPRFQVLHEHAPNRVNAVAMIGPAILSAAAVEALAGLRGRRSLLPLVGAPLLLVVLLTAALARGGTVVGWPPLVAATVATGLVALAVAAPGETGPPSGLARWAARVPLLLLVVAVLQPTGGELVGSWLGRPLSASWAPYWEADPVRDRAIAVNAAQTDPGGAGEVMQARVADARPVRYVGYGGIGHPDERGMPPTYQHGRTHSSIQAILVNARAVRLDLYEIQGYNPVQLRRYGEFMTALNGRPQDYHTANLLPTGVQSPLLNLLNVGYVLVDANLPQERADVVALTAGKREVFRNDAVIVYENPSSLPHAWIVHDFRPVARGEALPLLTSGAVDSRQMALVEGPSPATAEPTTAGPESARVTHYEPDALTITTTAATPGLLVVSEIYEGGWRASVDGEPVEILPTNHALRGVLIPAGTHVVELRYEPASLRLGLVISGITAMAMLAACAATWRRALTRKPSQQLAPNGPTIGPVA